MEYKSKAVIEKIIATSRVAVKVKDNYYTVEYSEERSLPTEANPEKEREILWNDVNKIVDDQVAEILVNFK